MRRLLATVSSLLVASTGARAETVLPPEDALAAVALEQDDSDPECSDVAEIKSVGSIKLARLVECSAEVEVSVRLALRVAGKSYLSEPLLTAEHNGGLNSELKDPTLTASKGRLVLRLTRHTYTRGERNSRGALDGDTADETFLVYCGVGPSRTPSCTPPIPLTHRRVYHPHPSKKRNRKPPKDKVTGWEMKAVVSRDAVELTAPARARKAMDDKTRALLGSHPLRFP